MPKLCIDCGEKLKNRSKQTLRCWACRVFFLSNNAGGRKTTSCIDCGKKLSTLKNTTNKCFPCYLKTRLPHDTGRKGVTPWNKGKSIYSTEEDKIKSQNKLRRLIRKNNRKQCIADSIRTLIRNSLRRAQLRKDSSRTRDLLGCDIDFFIEYISNQFTGDMTWENYGNGFGKWNFDHIIPLSSFDLTSLSEQKKAFHYSNCQPMNSISNMRKGSTMPLKRKQIQIILPMSTTAVLTDTVTV